MREVSLYGPFIKSQLASTQLTLGPCVEVGGVPREQKMLKGHLTRVIYHRVY